MTKVEASLFVLLTAMVGVGVLLFPLAFNIKMASVICVALGSILYILLYPDKRIWVEPGMVETYERKISQLRESLDTTLEISGKQKDRIEQLRNADAFNRDTRKGLENLVSQVRVSLAEAIQAKDDLRRSMVSVSENYEKEIEALKAEVQRISVEKATLILGMQKNIDKSLAALDRDESVTKTLYPVDDWDEDGFEDDDPDYDKEGEDTGVVINTPSRQQEERSPMAPGLDPGPANTDPVDPTQPFSYF